MVLVSSCLSGIKCRYNGRRLRPRKIIKKLKNIVPVCPEQLGGLPTPRSKARIINGTGNDVLDGKARVVNESGRDMTRNFIRGAMETLRIAGLLNIKRAYLRTDSPSCGEAGVTTALLVRSGIQVYPIE